MIPRFNFELMKLGSIIMEKISEFDFLNNVTLREAMESLSILHFSIADGLVVKIKGRCMVIL